MEFKRRFTNNIFPNSAIFSRARFARQFRIIFLTNNDFENNNTLFVNSTISKTNLKILFVNSTISKTNLETIWIQNPQNFHLRRSKIPYKISIESIKIPKFSRLRRAYCAGDFLFQRTTKGFYLTKLSLQVKSFVVSERWGILPCK